MKVAWIEEHDTEHKFPQSNPLQCSQMTCMCICWVGWLGVPAASPIIICFTADCISLYFRLFLLVYHQVTAYLIASVFL